MQPKPPRNGSRKRHGCSDSAAAQKPVPVRSLPTPSVRRRRDQPITRRQPSEAEAGAGDSPRRGPLAGPVDVSVVVPVFNEEEVLHSTYERLKGVMDELGNPYELLFVNDGSTDRTGAILDMLRARDARIGVLTFSRNFGHQPAITAGMEHAQGDAIVVIDADLQDPPELIPQLVARWREGFDVVYAKRQQRRGESPFKRWAAALFYRSLRRLTDVPIPLDTGDFRLIDRRVRDVLCRMPEKRRFVRGLVAWLGFRQAAVEFVRDGRAAGRSKYSLAKMLSLAADAVTSFSDRPLRIAGYAGATLALACLIALTVLGFLALLRSGPPAWSFGLAAFGLIDGITLLALGILGGYMARVYDEVRDRPLYVLDSKPPWGGPDTLDR